jgi:hypothetical protein
VDVPGTSRDAKAPEKPSFQQFAGRLWTLVDVYGRPRMAPRAGFEVIRKLLNGRGVRARDVADTPGDTPLVSALQFLSRLTSHSTQTRSSQSRTHLTRQRMVVA